MLLRNALLCLAESPFKIIFKNEGEDDEKEEEEYFSKYYQHHYKIFDTECITCTYPKFNFTSSKVIY